jgi:hypothetical protein
MRASSLHVTCRPFLFPCLAAASMGLITAILSSCVLEETLPALRKQPKQGEPLGIHPWDPPFCFSSSSGPCRQGSLIAF